MEESQSVEAGEGYENPWKEADRKLSTPPAAENASNQTDETGSGQRFKVAKVQFEPNRPEYSPLKPCKASSVVLESPSSSRPVSMLDVSATIGYATNEAVPMTVFYRNEAHDQRTRPTLQELRKGFDIDHEQQVCNFLCLSSIVLKLILSLEAVIRLLFCILSRYCQTFNNHSLIFRAAVVVKRNLL